MRYVVLLSIFSFAVILAKSATDRICFDETDEDVCESVHIQCGVTIHVEDACGNKRNVECKCPAAESCSLETLTCQ